VLVSPVLYAGNLRGAAAADAWDSAYGARTLQEFNLIPALDLPVPAPESEISRPGTRIAQGEAVFPFTLPNLSGKDVTYDYSLPGSPVYGKASVLIFFASWCPYSQKELPYFEKLYEKYAGNGKVQFMGIRTRRAKEKENINDFVKRFGLKFLIVSDTPKDAPVENAVYTQYQIKGVPTVLIVDKAGIMRQVPPETEDYTNYVEMMSGLIDPLLSE